MIRIRASSLGKIMSEPTAKAAKEGEILSAGAKTFCYEAAKEFAYSYRKMIYSKPMEKGTQCEDQSIELLNNVFFTDYQKNTERKNTDYLTGECDIFTGDEIIDIKTSWDLSTFPATSDQAHDSGYEWQLRAYMHLWDCDHAKLAFCLIDTPDELINFEQQDLHFVSHIPSEMRVTVVEYERDLELEKLIPIKCKAAQALMQTIVERIQFEHTY